MTKKAKAYIAFVSFFCCIRPHIVVRLTTSRLGIVAGHWRACYSRYGRARLSVVSLAATGLVFQNFGIMIGWKDKTNQTTATHTIAATGQLLRRYVPPSTW